MLKGRVIGEVWATKKCPALAPYRLRLVVEQGASGASTGRVLVAADELDTETGRLVMVSFGSGARNAIRPGASTNRDLVCECAITQVIEGDSAEEDSERDVSR